MVLTVIMNFSTLYYNSITFPNFHQKGNSEWEQILWNTMKNDVMMLLSINTQ